MSSSQPAGGGKPPAPPKEQPKKKEEKPKQQKAAPIDVVDDTPFPAPDLYFKVYDSELDEPEFKVKQDVNKLYDKWLAEYGRRWPEKGLNTEDLVWLAEEAYKPEAQPGQYVPGVAARRPTDLKELQQLGVKPVEVPAYDGEFITDDWEDKPAGKAASRAADGAAPAPRRKNLSNYEATKAGANWVTDEFESEDYEAGNLELVWGQYLWDREGLPTVMPEGPPDEAAGEESEEWDDFLTAYRPRHVDSDEARAAVWVTDEFESDEDHTESEWEPEYVGAGLGLDAEDPINPQYSLRHSTHPLAPFPGEALKWASYVYDDGTTFEGLTREAVPHGMGVMIFGNGTGGGFHFRDIRVGDKYEGEFQAGYAHGLGQFTSEQRGEVYLGEFFAGQRHGCGIKINMKPYYYLLERGEEPVSAYRKTHEQIMRNIEFRTWFRNKALGSEYEDEVVLAQVAGEDAANPYDIVLANAQHERKLRDWGKMDSTDKAMTKMVEIIESVGAQRSARRAAMGLPESYFSVDRKGRIMENLDSHGDDTDWDSIDLQVGQTTEGGPGLGWQDNAVDSDEFPPEARLLEGAGADVADDKYEESEDKEAILGGDLVNPYTGLSLKDYLDGYEGKHNELAVRVAEAQAIRDKGKRGADKDQRVANVRRFMGLAAGSDGGAGTAEHRRGSVAGAPEDPSAGGLPAGGPALSLSGAPKISRSNQNMVVSDMERLERELPRGKGATLRGDDTDTRFETESETIELCDLAEILGTVDEATEVVAKARMWRWKPYGEVTIRYAQDGQGAPVELMQDPLHYPHGTKFMAPGPLGQCHPIPNDANVRAEMVRVARNYEHIYSLYNFDYDPEPGSVQYKIDQRIKRAQEIRMGQLARMAEAADEEYAAAEQLAAAGKPQLQLASASAPGGSAFASMRMGGFGMAPPVASISMGMGRASKVVLNLLARAARHAPTRTAGRPHVMRPTQQPRRAKAAAGQQRQQQQQHGRPVPAHGGQQQQGRQWS